MSDFDLLPEALEDGVPDCRSDDFCGVREDDDDDCPEDRCSELGLEFEPDFPPDLEVPEVSRERSALHSQ